MSREFPKLSTCCFCISLRTATLFLAFLGLVGNLVISYVTSVQSSSDELYSRLIPSVSCALICSAGVYGIWKNNSKMIRLFAIYYWMSLILSVVRVVVCSVVLFQSEDFVCNESYSQPNLDMDADTCHEYYFKIALSTVLISSLFVAIDAYGAIAVWSYYRQVAPQTAYCTIEQDTKQNFEKKQPLEV